MNSIYLPYEKNKLLIYKLIFNNDDILKLINKKSLELGAKKSDSYNSIDLLKSFESYDRGTNTVKNCRIYEEKIHQIYNHKHDFWNGESHDVEDYSLYTAFYNENDFILKLIDSLTPKKDIFRDLALNNEIINDYNRNRIFVDNRLLEEYLIDTTYMYLIEFSKIIPYISTHTEIIKEIMSMITLCDEKILDYKNIKDNILEQIQEQIKICEESFLSPMGTDKIEGEIINLLNKNFDKISKNAIDNEKILKLKKI